MFDETKESKDDYIKRRYLTDGKGTTTIGKELGISEQSVSKRIAKMGFERRAKHQKIFDKDHKDVCDMYVAGLSADEIGEKYGLAGPVTILRTLRKYGVQIRDASECHIKYNLRDDYFDNIDTPEKAYVLGLIYADGYNCKQQNYVSIALAAKDIDILQKVSSLIYLNDSEKRIRTFTRVRNFNDKIVEEQGCSLGFNRKHFCDVLHKMGCSQAKSMICKFPEWLTDENLIPHFIRGYYDGDGGVFLSKLINAALARIVGTIPFIESIMTLAKKNLGINFHVEKINESMIRAGVSGNQQVKLFLDWIYKDSTIHMDRKYNLYQRLLKEMSENSRTFKGLASSYVNGVYQEPVSYDPNEYEIGEE